MTVRTKKCPGRLCQGVRRPLTAFREQPGAGVLGVHSLCREDEALLARERMKKTRANKAPEERNRRDELHIAREAAKKKLVLNCIELFRTLYEQELLDRGIPARDARAIAGQYTPRGGRPKMNAR